MKMHKTFFGKNALGIAAAMVGFVVVGQAPAANAVGIYGPTPYFQASDSPFASAFPGFPTPGSIPSEPGGYFYLEDFEDELLNTPGVTASAGTVLLGLRDSANTLTDSVDGDDGEIQESGDAANGFAGSGSKGNSFYSNGSNVLRFTFDASVLGKLPSHVGIVLTDVGFLNGQNSGPIGGGNAIFRAFGAGNQLLTTIINNNFGDDLANGGTAEDRFFGARYYPGISYFEIEVSNSTDWEVDHLQYGYVPTPALLPGLIGMGIAAVRRKKQEEISESA